MSVTKHNFTPFIPQPAVLESSGLADKAMLLFSVASKLSGMNSAQTREILQQHMKVINSYYSNLIEGNHTEPYEIRAAQRGEFATDGIKEIFN